MPAEQAKRDVNYVPSLVAVDSATGLLPTRLHVNATTHRLLVDATINSNAEYAEDAASASGDTGMFILAIQKATPADLAGTDGDYAGLQMSAGRLWVSAKLEANSGVDIGDVDVLSVIPGTGATNLGKAIDTATGATDTGVLSLATRDDALSALTPIEGDNIQLRVDANGALWTHDDALDAALGGTELQVDVVASLPAGTNAIGKLAANSGVDIGDVDILSIAAGDNNIGNVDIVSGTITTVSALGSGTTGPQKAEDAVSADLDVGIPAMAVRKATPANTSGTDGDYEFLQISAGRLWASATIDAALPAGTNAIGKLAANSGVDIGDVDVLTIPNVTIGTMANLTESLVDDAGFTPATSRVLPIGFEFDDTTPDSVNEGDIGAARMSANRNIYMTIRDAAGNERGVNVNASNQLTVSVDNNPVLGAGTAAIGKLAANSGVDIGDVDILSIAAGDNNIGNVDIASQVPGTGATNLGKAIDSVGGATDTGVATLVIRDDALAALTPIEGDYVALRVDANGALWTHDDALDAALGGSELQVDVVAALPAGTNAIGKLAANSGVDIGDVDILSIAAGDNNIGNVDIVSGTITTVSTVTALGAGTTGPMKAEDVAHATGDQGFAVWAVRDDTIGIASGAEGDYEPFHTNEDGALWVEENPSTKGGWSVGNFTSGDTYTALTATAQVIKASAGKFGGYYIYNPNTSAMYVLVYNIAAASVTVGTSTALLVFCIPASSAANLEFSKGIPFGTAMSIAAATTGGGNTAPTTALEAMVWYK